MPSGLIYRLAGAAALSAALGIGASGSALACGRDCGGYGYRPAPVYSAPPVYSYSYVPYDRPVYRVSYYTTRVNIFSGPRWGYAAAYYNPRRHSGCGRRAYGCTHRAYMSGPIVHVSRPIGRSWRRW